MSLPIDHRPLLKLLSQVLEQSACILHGIGLVKSYADVNCDNETGRVVIVDRATDLCSLGYQLAHLAGKPEDVPLPLCLGDEPLPMFPTAEETDRAIHSGACRHIRDVASFTGNLHRITDPAMRQKVALLLHDWGNNLAADMAPLCHQDGHEPV